MQLLFIWHKQQRPFNGLWSGTTRVGRYQKKHSPTHTHPDHRASFITFLHLYGIKFFQKAQSLTQGLGTVSYGSILKWVTLHQASQKHLIQAQQNLLVRQTKHTRTAAFHSFWATNKDHTLFIFFLRCNPSCESSETSRKSSWPKLM